LLETDAEARRLYIQLIDQEVELPCLVVSEATLAELNLVPVLPARRAPPRIQWRRRVQSLAAAVVLLAAALWALLPTVEWRRKNEVNDVPVPPGTREKKIPQAASSFRPSPAPDAWKEDFESGTAAGWTGQLTAAGLPSGSGFGMTPVAMRYPDAIAYGIRMPEEWDQGLFQLAQRSTLHVTYRLGPGGNVNVFMHTIGTASDGYEFQMYQLRPSQAFRNTGEWLTASIPFGQFVRKIPVQPGGNMAFAGGPPQAGELVTTIMFSSPSEIDLVIDKVSITPDGPAREEVRPMAPSR
jgi:hypothetical protein